MAIALVSSVSAITASYGAATVTTAPISTVGANLIVIYTASDATGSVVDNRSNSYTGLTARDATPSNPQFTRMFYCLNPTTNASHTFTSNYTTGPSIAVAAFSGVLTVSAFDTQNGAISTASVTSLQTGSITPSFIGDLIITGFGNFTPGFSASIDLGFTIATQVQAVMSVGYGSGLAYLNAASTSAVNPRWTYGSACATGMTIATFKTAAAPTGKVFSFPELDGMGGVGQMRFNKLR